MADPTVLAAAAASPSGLIEQVTTPALIDEAQLVPELLLPIKRRVDLDTRPGSFLPTGSSRLGRAQLGGSDPLAGRPARTDPPAVVFYTGELVLPVAERIWAVPISALWADG